MEGGRVVKQISGLLILSIKQWESSLPLVMSHTYVYFDLRGGNVIFSMVQGG